MLFKLESPWRDGTSHLRFESHELFERLASLVPRPRANFVRYQGVFAPNSKWRPFVIPAVLEEETSGDCGVKVGKGVHGRHWIALKESAQPQNATRPWAVLLSALGGVAAARLGRLRRCVGVGDPGVSAF